MKRKIIGWILGGLIPVLFPILGVAVIISIVSDAFTDIPEKADICDFSEYQKAFDSLDTFMNSNTLYSDNREFFYTLYISEHGKKIPDFKEVKALTELTFPISEEEKNSQIDTLSLLLKRFEKITNKPMTDDILDSILTTHNQILHYCTGSPLPPGNIVIYNLLKDKTSCSELIIPFDSHNQEYSYAILDGTVIDNSYSKEYGNYIRIEHDDGIISTYGYLDKALPLTGTIVKAGDTIGVVGNTGRATDNSLFFQVKQNAENLNLCEMYKQFNFESLTKEE